MVAAGIDELIEEITIGSVDLHTVESGLQRISRSARELSDNVGHLLDLQGPRRHERNQFPLAVLILDERLPARLDGRGRDRKHAVGLQRRIEPAMRPESQDALLAAIAKARGWIDDIRLGRIGSFAEIAEREAQGKRHIRLLAPLAFLSPRIIAAIADGTAPGDLTVTDLAKALPYSWAAQEETIGLSS